MDDDSGSRRRSRRSMIIGWVVVVLAVTAVSWLNDDTTEREASAPAAATATTVPGSRPGPRTSAGLLDRPTRGSLASDSAFLDGVRALPWSDGQQEKMLPDGTVLSGPQEPPPDQRHVVFAGDVPGGRWAVVVGPVHFGVGPGGRPGITGDADLAAIVFTGPPGAAPDQLTRPDGRRSVPADWTPALWDAATGTLLVVAAPGDRVEVSERPEIAADGRAAREYRSVETTDGVAIVRLPSRGRYDHASVFRVVRQGRPQSALLPSMVTAPEDSVPDIPIDFARGAPSTTGRSAAAWTAEQVLAELGLRSSDVEVAAQWVGTVPGSGPGEVAVVTVTLPSGAVVVAAQLMGPALPDGAGIGGFCGRAVLPAGPPVARRMYALTCDVVDVGTGAGRGTNLVVVAPGNVGLVRTYDDDGTFLSEHPTADGVVVVPLPRGADAVEALTRGGITLGRVELLRYADRLGN